jgi:hypothetical protein
MHSLQSHLAKASTANPEALFLIHFYWLKFVFFQLKTWQNFFSDAKNMTGNHKKPAPRPQGEDRAMAAPFGGAI